MPRTRTFRVDRPSGTGEDPTPPASPREPCGRLDRLRGHELPGGLRLAVARFPPARMLGLAWLAELPEGHGLLIPRCRSIHTFGMRFPIDIVFLDREGRTLEIEEAVPRRRQVSARGARAVVETRAGEAQWFLDAGVGRPEAGLDLV